MLHIMFTIESMNITNESITLDIGESEQIDITNANEIEEDYIFLSLKPTIATVDENGLVTGVSEGTTSITIRGTTSNKTKTVNVTVEVEENNPISYVNRQVDGEITAGDEIAIDTEHFYVVSSDANETILLSKYNLYVGDIYDVDTSSWKYTRNKTLSNSDSGYGLQKSTAIGAYYPDSGNTAQFIGTVAFSGTNYWDDSVCQNTGKSWSCTGTSGLSSGYTGSYSGNPYPDVYRSNLNTTAPLYNYYYGYGLAQNNGYTISYYVEEYVNKLKQLGAPDTITGRLLLQEEAVNLGCDASASPWSCASSTNNWVYSTSYYLGSALVMNDVWGVTSYGHFGHGEFVDSSDLGVRPVIVISTSDI